ncbi:NRPS protein [Claviceps citrina]|nr:NRPS protein [Claviceps citrina]
MSPSDVDESTLAGIASSCNTSTAAIEDLYECTPTQIDLIRHPDVYQFVLSINSTAILQHFREALRLVIARNSILRTRFSEYQPGKTLQVVFKLREVETDIIFTHHSGDLDEYLQKSRERPLKQWLGLPLFQAAFIGNKFVATIHHAVIDYWSWFTLINVDFMAACLGQPIPNRPPFKDFVSYCNAIDESDAKQFWQRRFKGVPSCFPQVSNSGTDSRQMSAGAAREITFQSGAMGDVVHAQIPYFIEAAWAMTSSIYAGNDSVAYGYLLSGRSSSSIGLQNTLGPTITEVPVQVDLQRNMTVGQLVKDRATSLRQLQTHPAVYWGIHKIRANIQEAKYAVRYGTLLNILPEHPLPPSSDDRAQDGREQEVQFDGMMSFEGNFPLHLMFKMNGDGFILDPRFDPESISERRLGLVLDQFEHVLRLLVQAPLHTKLSSLSLLNQRDKAQIFKWNSKLVTENTGQSSVHEAYRAQARVRPDAVAVEDSSQGNVATYRTLDQMSDSIANLLRSRGISRNVPVCLVFERSIWAIAAILGIMKAGGIWVPINTHASREDRIAICSKMQAGLVLVSSTQYASCLGLAADILAVNPDTFHSFIESEPLHKGKMESCSTDTALVYFTSGSTCSSGLGEEPQGIMFAHHTLISSLKSQAKALGWQPGCRVLHSARYASKGSVCEVLGTLLSGGCICIVSDIESDMDHGLCGITPAAPADWAILASSTLDCMPQLSRSRSCQLSILCTDEPRRTKDLTAWLPLANRFVRGWGTGETSFISTIADVTDFPRDMEAECIGFPIGSCSMWIVNTHNVHDLAPVGSLGELLVSGASIAKGYWADDVKTAASFIAPPQWATSFAADAGKFYRTGYLARYKMDGSIALVGKRTNRFKLRGHMVQLEQLERTVRLHCAQVRDVACLTQISAGRTQIVAVVCLADQRLPSVRVLKRVHDGFQEIVDQHIAAVRERVESELPAAVIPDIWIAVEQLPWADYQVLDRLRVRQWLKDCRTS